MNQKIITYKTMYHNIRYKNLLKRFLVWIQGRTPSSKKYVFKFENDNPVSGIVTLVNTMSINEPVDMNCKQTKKVLEHYQNLWSQNKKGKPLFLYI